MMPGSNNEIYDKYLTRKEAELILKDVEKEHDECREEIRDVRKRLTELERFRWKIAGAVLVVAFIASLFGDIIGKAFLGR